jgi:hypothetical protein
LSFFLEYWFLFVDELFDLSLCNSQFHYVFRIWTLHRLRNRNPNLERMLFLRPPWLKLKPSRLSVSIRKAYCK